MEWKPINSAPKDGTEIIIGFENQGDMFVHVAWWRDVDENLELLGWEKEDTGWWSYTRNSMVQEKLDADKSPAFWMPLPEPPTALKDKGA